MANATKGFQHDNRAQIGATHESLWDVLVQIRKDETYVTSNAPKVKVTDQVHMWPTKEPRTITDRASIQGADPTYDNTNTGRTSNYTQVFEVGYELTNSRMAADAAGKDPKAQERDEAMKDFKNFLEFAVIRGSLVSGNNSTASKMKGLKQFASTLATSQSGVSLSEKMYNDYMGNAWDNGMEIDTVIVGRVLKSRISGFTAGSTKNVDAEQFKLYGRVDVYEGDFGIQKIIKHRYVTISGDTNYDLLAYDSNYVRTGEYDAVRFEQLAKTGAAEREMVYGEYTLQVDNEKSIVLGSKHL